MNDINLLGANKREDAYCSAIMRANDLLCIQRDLATVHPSLSMIKQYVRRVVSMLRWMLGNLQVRAIANRSTHTRNTTSLS